MKSLKIIAVIVLIAAVIVGGLTMPIKKDNDIENNYAYGKAKVELLSSVNPGVRAMFSNLYWYEACLLDGITKGQKWVYSNSNDYVPQSTSFENMLASENYGANCALPANWVLIDMGIMTEGQRFWGSGDGSFANYSNVAPSIEKACDIISLSGNESFRELLSAGTVKPGDIILTYGHTFIYIGDNKIFAAGHDAAWHSDSTASHRGQSKGCV